MTDEKQEKKIKEEETLEKQKTNLEKVPTKRKISDYDKSPKWFLWNLRLNLLFKWSLFFISITFLFFLLIFFILTGLRVEKVNQEFIFKIIDTARSWYAILIITLGTVIVKLAKIFKRQND